MMSLVRRGVSRYLAATITDALHQVMISSLLSMERRWYLHSRLQYIIAVLMTDWGRERERQLLVTSPEREGQRRQGGGEYGARIRLEAIDTA